MLSSRPLPMVESRAPALSARCTCEHPLMCYCSCHGRDCDPAETACDLEFLPDDGGYTRWGCAICTPGAGAAHTAGCDVIGWNVPRVPPA